MSVINRAFSLTLLTALGLGLGQGQAQAGNGLHPRTPVIWTDAPCMTIIDRSHSALFPLSYDIPYEDTELTPDEVSDSRTHQFFAFCRDHHREELLPSWITEADVNAAVSNGLGDAANVDTELDVFENAPHWADCWVRITDDHERRPITFAAAAEPVVWDTMALPAGTWAVEGYTYEPWANEWWPHPGVFKIIDDPDPAASGPAAALNFNEVAVEYGDEATLRGCVDAMDGATMTASWALSGFGSEPQWQVFAADLPAPSGAFELGFVPPAETISNTVLIKLDVSDPMGRSWTAHAIQYVVVTEKFGGDDDDGCDDGGGFIVDPCEPGEPADTGEPADAGETSDAGETAGTEGAAEGEAGCSCSTGSGSGVPAGLWLLGVGLGLGLIRRHPPAA